MNNGGADLSSRTVPPPPCRIETEVSAPENSARRARCPECDTSRRDQTCRRALQRRGDALIAQAQGGPPLFIIGGARGAAPKPPPPLFCYEKQRGKRDLVHL